MIEELFPYIYTIVALLITLLGISIYRDDLENHPHKDVGCGIFLVSVLWPLAIFFGILLGITGLLIEGFKFLYRIKI